LSENQYDAKFVTTAKKKPDDHAAGAAQRLADEHEQALIVPSSSAVLTVLFIYQLSAYSYRLSGWNTQLTARRTLRVLSER
jgi:hypothetical protein